jgi:hypothetical protein
MEDTEVMEESVVGLESKYVYLNHHGRVHTPLPGPAIITEKGVEQGQVIGLYFTGGRIDRRAGSIDLDWSGVGGVEKTIPGVEDVIKYVAEVVEMPRCSPMNYKPPCSKWCEPSDRVYGNYEMYDPYMGKEDGKRRGRQSRCTVGVMIDRMEGGKGESKVETEIGGSRKRPVWKGEPGLRSVEGGGCSPKVSGNVRKFVSVYQAKLKLKNKEISAGGNITENTHSYFSVYGPLKTQFDISSPVKRLDLEQFGDFLSTASKRKYGVNMEHGHQRAGGIFSAGTDSDWNGGSEVLGTKKPQISGGQ